MKIVVVVAFVSFASVFKMLLWLRFWGHLIWKCCCGIDSGHIGFEHVVVALDS